MNYIISKGQSVSNDSRNKSIDIYKGILIILVVIRHVLQYSVIDEGGILTNFIWAIQMPGFMLVAGYFCSRNVGNLKTVKKRIAISSLHYLVPFLSWYFIINGLILGKRDRNPILGLKKLITHVDSGLWFLWVLFVLSIIGTLANYSLSSENFRLVKTISLFVIFFSLLLFLVKIYGINFLGIKFILYYAIFYFFGWLVKCTEKWWRQWWSIISEFFIFLCLFIFIAIIFNFDLYRADDSFISIMMRAIAGFTGNVVLFSICITYKSFLSKFHLDFLGKYTLEIYATHMEVNNLMDMENRLFTIAGFANFLCSLFFTILFTTIIIITFKAIPLADLFFYGKNKEKTRLISKR